VALIVQPIGGASVPPWHQPRSAANGVEHTANPAERYSCGVAGLDQLHGETGNRCGNGQLGLRLAGAASDLTQ
jgi:hypothetical protein